MRFFTLVLFFFVFPYILFSQANLEVTILNGEATTTCTDIFSPTPNTQWEVNVQGDGWEIYPKRANCYNELPNVQFTGGSFACPRDVPPTIEICFKAYDNDAFFGCAPRTACEEEVCANFPVIPAVTARRHRLDLPTGGDSGGFVEFEIAVKGQFTRSGNDHICGAHEFGLLDFGETVGDASAGGFDNICAVDGVDPHPKDFDPDAWHLHKGVWFTFDTGPNPSSALFLNQVSDPLGLRNNISLQGAVFTSSTDDCEGALDLVAFDWEADAFNDTVRFYCPEPNTKYFVLIDGIWTTSARDGHFGFEVVDPGVEERGDEICDHVQLGQVPDVGLVASNGQLSNFCASSNNDPVTSFSTEKTIWASFEAPSTGHVLVKAISETKLDPIDLEIAVFESSDGTCGGTFSERGSISINRQNDEFLELSCLTEGETYFIMIDGDVNNPEGLFELEVEALADDTPVTNQTVSICVNESLPVGNNSYDQSGFYVDTILLGGGCDSVVLTTLTVLDSIKIEVVQQGKAQDLGSFTGIVIASATGGDGNFTFTWSDGQNGSTATNLEGGQTYCVDVMDGEGCVMQECIYIEYITPILPTFSSDEVRCFGELNGSLTFSVNNGEPPYFYSISGPNQTAVTTNGLGDDELVTLTDLGAGFYDIFVRDDYFDTTFTVEVVQPELVEIDVVQQVDASCFKVCDGVISLEGIGGVGNYQFTWEDGNSVKSLSNLCADTYIIDMEDGNGCQTSISLQIKQPDEFIATGIEDKGVTCLGWTDGIGSITTNGTPTDFQWETGAIGQQVTDLAAGSYSVTVTNADGCLDTTFVEITEPEEPYEVEIELGSPIICKDDSNGALNTTVYGGNTISYNWNTNDRTPSIEDLPTGWYAITVTSESNCEAIDSFFLDQPDVLQALPEGNQLTCLDPFDGGVVQITTVNGGVAPYEFSVDGANFTSNDFVENLVPGQYDLIVKDDLGCEREFPFEILPPPPIDVELSGETTVDLGDIVSLSANTQNTNASFEWSSDQWDCITPDCSQIEFLPLNTQRVQVTATDSIFFCTATAIIEIDVIKNYKVFIPSAFSPNNDGLNDNLAIFGGNDVAIIKNFKVFDRYGATIYSQKDIVPNDESIGWDGSWKGSLLQTGVYVFFAKVEFIDGAVEIFKGDVTVVR